MSDTANATFIYEKFGFSARLAWNWRDEFLNQASRGGYRNPTFVNAFKEWDLNISYDVTDNLALSFEAINLTGEDLRTCGRTNAEYWFIQDAPTLLAGGSLQVRLNLSDVDSEGAAVRSGLFFALAAAPKVVLDAPWRKWLAKPR